MGSPGNHAHGDTKMIKRTFTHRTFGLIGEVNLKASEGTTLSLNGKELPPSSVEYLLTFALQSLQDAYAGAKTPDEAVASWTKKRDSLIAGTIGTRTGTGTSVSDETRIGRNLIKGALKAKWGKDSPEWKEFTGLSDADQAAKLDELLGKNREKLQPRIDAEVQALRAERERKAKLAKASDLEL